MTIAADASAVPAITAGHSEDAVSGRHIYRYACGECARPAVSFDDAGVPRCPAHVTVFVPAAGRPDPEDLEAEAAI